MGSNPLPEGAPWKGLIQASTEGAPWKGLIQASTEGLLIVVKACILMLPRNPLQLVRLPV